MSQRFKIVSGNELKNHQWYSNLYPLMVSFGHQVVIDESNVWRWRPTAFASYINGGDAPFRVGALPSHGVRRGQLSINDLWEDLYYKKHDLKPEDVMKYYMGIGYSLSGFQEVFEQKLAKPFYDDADEGESILDYVAEKWRGKIALGVV